MQSKEELFKIAQQIKSPAIRWLVENLWQWPDVVREEQARMSNELKIAEKHFGEVAKIVRKAWGLE